MFKHCPYNALNALG